MAQTIDNQATGDDYTDATTIEEIYLGSGGYGSIVGADVFCQMQYGKQGETYWASEVHVPVGTIQFPDKITGVRFRSYLSGVSATVTAAVFEGPEPQLVIGAGGQSNQTVNGIPVFNVQAYGAKGDGSHDDTTSVQSAIDACSQAGGGIVYFPSGVYQIASTLKVPTGNIMLLGPTTSYLFDNYGGKGGAILRSKTGFSGSYLMDISDPAGSTVLAGITVRGLGFLGQRTSGPGGLTLATVEGIVEACSFYFLNGDGLNLFDFGSGVPIAGYDNSILNNRVISVAGDGIHCVGVTDSIIIGNVIQATTGIGIHHEQAGVQIIGNHVYTTSYPTGCAISAQLQDTLILGNRIQSYQGGIVVGGASTGGCLISGNLLQASSNPGDDNLYDGIVVNASVSSTPGPVIGANTFRNVTSTNIRFRYGVNISSANVVGSQIAAQQDDGTSPVSSAWGSGAVNDQGTSTDLQWRDRRSRGLGLIAQHFDRSTKSGNSLMAGGTAYAMMVELEDGDVISDVQVECTTNGSGVTLFKAAVYSLDGTVEYASSADQSAQFSSTGVKTLPLSAAWQVPRTASYLIVILSTATTTLPTLSRGAVGGAFGTPTAGKSPYCVAGTGLSDLPLVPLTFTTANAFAFWAACL